MNIQDEVKTGESPDTPPQPSARPSIHNHDRCMFADRENMGRYGIKGCCEKTSHKTGTSPQQDMGVDEVDNVLSKFACQSTPITMKRSQKGNKTRERRNSLSISEQQFSDDSDSESDLLAKSLPANLPSYYCSEDLAHLSLPTDFYKTINDNSTTASRNGGRRYLSNDHLNSQNVEQNTQYGPKKKKSTIPLYLPILGLVSVVAAVYFKDIHNFVYESNRISYYDESKFSEDLNALGEKYRINDHSILEIQTGISTILERNDTGSFVFLYDSGIVNFNDLQFRKFMKDIASMAARYLRNDTTSIQPTIIQSSELNMETHSELMTKYKNDVAKTGVMLIQDVDRVPSSLAMAFHYFCDEYNPLVTKSAIFFTLNLAKCPNNSVIKGTHDDVEKCLANKWSRVPKDNIKPLLARVVNVVVDVTGVS